MADLFLSMNSYWGSMKPRDIRNGMRICPGFFSIYGATAFPNGVNFTIHSRYATSCELLLFHSGEQEPFAVFPFEKPYQLGNAYSMFIYDFDIEEYEYAYRFDGPHDFKEGHIFDKSKVILDPYARAVTGQGIWGVRPSYARDGFVYHGKVITDTYDWGYTPQPNKPLEDLIIYEAHVRGFTKHSSSGVAHPGTFAGMKEKIPYLKELGINAVELMPIFEFDEFQTSRVVDGKLLYNYWGYNTICFFAPNSAYAASGNENRQATEFKDLVRSFHDAGIEVILDVVFNHTGEGNEKGPFFSFKGIDNKIYYMLTPDGYYYNFSGCGNTVNCNHPIVLDMIISCLRYWVEKFHIDGFRFDLASIMDRAENGAPMEHPPILKSLAFDPILGKTKLIAEAWDAGGLYQVGSFPSWRRWAEWNGKYRDDLRRFLKGDDGMAQAAANRILGSLDLYHPDERGHNATVNFLNCHDGFTLCDLYSYNMRHNEANGWNNTDGNSATYSWNCGEEGPSENPEVNTLRRRMYRNAFATLLCSRGAAMFLAGDEFLNTQFGNNNAYCQDNEISWLNWEDLKKNHVMFSFVRKMIKLRMDHPILRKKTVPTSCNYPDSSIYREKEGEHTLTAEAKCFGILYAGKKEGPQSEDDYIFYAVNAYWEPLSFTFPHLPNGRRWQLEVDTWQEHVLSAPLPVPPEENVFVLQPRSVQIFSVVPETI